MSEIKFTGNHPICERVITGYYSLDHAFVNHAGDIGVPIGCSWETYGAKGIGKSSFTYSLAGLIAERRDSNIVLCDFDGYDERYLSLLLSCVGFDREVHTAYDKEDEKQLMEMLDWLEDDKKACDVGILDSISAITPIGEVEGEIGERNMGQRAFAMAQFSRRGLHVHRFSKKPKTILALNHWIQKMGGTKYEYISPGGSVKDYLFTVRVHLKRAKEFPDGSYILQGKVEKNRWGYSDRVFYIFMVAGVGMHKGMSALWDCIMYKQATYDNGTVRLNEMHGRLSSLVKAAKIGDDVFGEFYESLEKLNANTEDIETGNEGNDSSEVDALQD